MRLLVHLYVQRAGTAGNQVRHKEFATSPSSYLRCSRWTALTWLTCPGAPFEAPRSSRKLDISSWCQLPTELDAAWTDSVCEP